MKAGKTKAKKRNRNNRAHQKANPEQGGRIGLFKTIMLLIAVALVTAAVTSIIHESYKTIHVKKYPMRLSIVDENVIGLAVPVNDTITFGKVPRWASSVVKITVANYETYPVIAEISPKGAPLAGWVSISDNNFVLKYNETKEIKVMATPPKDAAAGNYTGTLLVVLKKYG